MHLFSPFTLKGLHLKNRVVMPPMCQYSVDLEDGAPNEWHYVHYTSRAVGGAGLIIVEMTDVEPDGRISNRDLGIWSDAHVAPFARIVEAVHRQDARIAVQIAHAGRKAQDAAVPVAPSAIAFDERSPVPRELTTGEAEALVEKFGQAARRAVAAGMDAIELHGAHGYLLHQFHSPLTNRRKDKYGADLLRFGVEAVQAVRSEMPSDMPLIMRVSAIEYADGGYDLAYSRQFCEAYRAAGVDMFHVSSGGEAPVPPHRAPLSSPGYQVELAADIRRTLQMPVIAVGLLDEPVLANDVVAREQTDLVAIGRAMLRDPYWAIHAARALGQPANIPVPYERSFAPVSRK